MAQHILRGLQKAARVVCVSESTRQQLLKHRLVDPTKTVVVHNGIHPAYMDHGGVIPINTNATELLHVGSTIPRKRIDILLRVFAECKKVESDLRLVHAGAPFTAEQSRLARSLGIDGAINCVSDLSAPGLAATYRRAALTLIPSEAEGFGLPLAESMACGTPAVASGIPALREVGGSAATYCDVGDIAGWSRDIIQLLHERRAHPEKRSRRVAQCRARAKFFSWDRNAREIAALYRTIHFEASQIGASNRKWIGKLSSPAAPDSLDAMPPAAISAREVKLF
jgi:glycosyltransferase involved in cell wall biosynthesis